MVTIFANAAGRFGVNTREAERFIKFLVVGAIGFVVDFGVFNLLLNPVGNLLAEGTAVNDSLATVGISASWLALTLPAVLAGIVSFIAAICSNFVWNRFWTYPDSRSKPIVKQFVMFFLVSITGIVLRIPIIAFTRGPFTHLTQVVLPQLTPDLIHRIGNNLALALSVLIILFWNFFVNRYWTYNDVD